jgi:hypothetical protein
VDTGTGIFTFFAWRFFLACEAKTKVAIANAVAVIRGIGIEINSAVETLIRG